MTVAMQTLGQRANEVGERLFVSVSKEEFERLPRPSMDEIQRALDEGRPDACDFCGGTPVPHLDPTMRFF